MNRICDISRGLFVVMIACVGTALGQDLDLPTDPLDKNLPAPIKRALFEAQTARDDGNYTEAIDGLKACLEGYPQFDNFHLRLMLGTNLLLAGRSEEAKAEYEASVGLKPESAQAWFQLARVSYELGDYNRAADAFERVNGLLAQPHSLIVFYAGVASYLAQQSDRAFRLLSELVGGAHGPPEYEWCRSYVAAANEANRAQETIPVLKGLVEREAGNKDAWKLLYQAAAMSDDYDRAAVALTVADFIEPLRTQELIQLGDLYMQIGVPTKAAPYYKRAIDAGDHTGSADLRERLASAYVTAHNYDGAVDYLSGVLAANGSARLSSLLGDVHYARDEYEEALAAFRRSNELDQENGRSLFMMGYCAYQLERDDEARQHLQAAANFDDQRERANQLLRAIERRQ